MTEMTTAKLGRESLAVIDLDLPADASPELLSEARGWCLTLIERLEQCGARQTASPSERTAFKAATGEIFKADDPWVLLRTDWRAKLQRAEVRLAEIDQALMAQGYNPEGCYFSLLQWAQP